MQILFTFNMFNTSVSVSVMIRASISCFLAEGKCYSCGWNSKGQLGLGACYDKTASKLVAVATDPVDVRCVRVSAGWDFSLVITGRRKSLTAEPYIYSETCT